MKIKFSIKNLKEDHIEILKEEGRLSKTMVDEYKEEKEEIESRINELMLELRTATENRLVSNPEKTSKYISMIAEGLLTVEQFYGKKNKKKWKKITKDLNKFFDTTDLNIEELIAKIGSLIIEARDYSNSISRFKKECHLTDVIISAYNSGMISEISLSGSECSLINEMIIVNF